MQQFIAGLNTRGGNTPFAVSSADFIFLFPIVKLQEPFSQAITVGANYSRRPLSGTATMLNSRRLEQDPRFPWISLLFFLHALI